MSKFDTWLGQLARAGKGPAPIDDVVRGKPWQAGVVLPADFTGASMTGGVSLEPDAASRLVSFTVTGPVVTAGVTRFTIALTGSETNGLPADADGDGIESFPYMLFLTPAGGTEELLFGGLFTVAGDV